VKRPRVRHPRAVRVEIHRRRHRVRERPDLLPVRPRPNAVDRLHDHLPHGPSSTSARSVAVTTHPLRLPRRVRADDIADGGDGHVVVVWQSASCHDVSGIGVFGQRFALDGTPEGREFRMNTFTARHQERASMALLGDGSFVVTWQSTRQDGSADGVIAQRFTRRAPLAGRLLVVRDGLQPTRRKIIVSSADPYFAASPQMGLDPVSDGLYLHVFGTVDGAEDSACMPLPASGWTARGDVFRPAYRYTDRAGLHGPCHAASLRNGRLKVACRAKQQPITYSLDEPAQVRVHAQLKSATATYCAAFGGAVLRDSAVLPVFRAAFAQAPEACTTPPTPCP